MSSRMVRTRPDRAASPPRSRARAAWQPLRTQDKRFPPEFPPGVEMTVPPPICLPASTGVPSALWETRTGILPPLADTRTALPAQPERERALTSRRTCGTRRTPVRVGGIGMGDSHKPAGSTAKSTGGFPGQSADGPPTAGLDSDPETGTRVPAVDSTRPDDDQGYLVARIAEKNDTVELSWAALQKLNSTYGRRRVTDALRIVHGFPPQEAVGSPYAYVEAICKAIT